MADYRAYIMGPDGHVQNRVDLLCDDETEAIRPIGRTISIAVSLRSNASCLLGLSLI